MQRTHVYLPEDLNREITSIAKLEKKPKAEVIRMALQKGIQAIKPKKSSSAQRLLDIAKEAQKLAKKYQVTGPRDLSENLDYYTWGGSKKNPKAKV